MREKGTGAEHKERGHIVRRIGDYLSLSKVEAAYVVALGAMLVPAYAGSNTLEGALTSLLDLLQVAGAGIIGLAILHWGIAYAQGNSHSREAFTHIGIGAGLILGAKTIATSI